MTPTDLFYLSRKIGPGRVEFTLSIGERLLVVRDFFAPRSARPLSAGECRRRFIELSETGRHLLQLRRELINLRLRCARRCRLSDGRLKLRFVCFEARARLRHLRKSGRNLRLAVEQLSLGLGNLDPARINRGLTVNELLWGSVDFFLRVREFCNLVVFG